MQGDSSVRILFYALALTSLTTVDSSGFIPTPAIAAPAFPTYVNTAPPNVPPFAYSVNVVNTGLRAPYIPPYVPSFAPYPTPFTFPLRAPYPSFPYTPFPYYPQFFYRR